MRAVDGSFAEDHEAIFELKKKIRSEFRRSRIKSPADVEKVRHGGCRYCWFVF